MHVNASVMVACTKRHVRVVRPRSRDESAFRKLPFVFELGLLSGAEPSASGCVAFGFKLASDGIIAWGRALDFFSGGYPSIMGFLEARADVITDTF